jgi:DNA-binding IclR family transcriptional regulator
VRRHDGRAVAALNIGTRIERATAEMMEGPFLALLRDAAAEVQPLLV